MEKVKIGIIGAGRIGRLHAENIVHIPQVEIKTISDLFVENLQEWANKIGIQNVTSDYNDILNDSEIDAVFICSPTNTHLSIIRDAAKAGKHIFCEKPISFSTEETKEALKIVKETGVKLQVGFNRRFDKHFKKVHDTVKEGVVGEPQLVKITSRDPEPPPADYIKSSGGLFVDMAIHDYDIARYVTGSEVVEVYVQGANLIDPAIGDLGDIDTALTILKFENGALGVIDNSRKAVYGYDQRVEVFGSKGSVANQNEQPTNVVVNTVDGIYQEKLKNFFLDRYKDAYLEETHAFIQSVLYDTPLVCKGEDGLEAELIAEAAKASLLTKQPVKIKREEYKLV